MDIHSGTFVWDEDKEAENIRKHGLNFTVASQAFADKERKIFIDSLHSAAEERYFCIGKARNQIITVRFTCRQGKIRIIGAGYWRKGRRYYEKED